jgi:hypothetical protein
VGGEGLTVGEYHGLGLPLAGCDEGGSRHESLERSFFLRHFEPAQAWLAGIARWQGIDKPSMQW